MNKGYAPKKQRRVVYTTDPKSVCPACSRPLGRCMCQDKTRSAEIPAGDGVVRVQRQTKGRKGAGVTRVTGVPLASGELAKLAQRLKKRCGVGGAVRESVIELQGDQRASVKQMLEQDGFRVKIAGG